MRTHLVNRLFLLLAVAAALFILTAQAPRVSGTPVCEESMAAPLEAGGPRLWESLSHQFVTAVAY